MVRRELVKCRRASVSMTGGYASATPAGQVKVVPGLAVDIYLMAGERTRPPARGRNSKGDQQALADDSGIPGLQRAGPRAEGPVRIAGLGGGRGARSNRRRFVSADSGSCICGECRLRGRSSGGQAGPGVARKVGPGTRPRAARLRDDRGRRRRSAPGISLKRAAFTEAVPSEPWNTIAGEKISRQVQ
jgi:hypothetical protein